MREDSDKLIRKFALPGETGQEAAQTQDASWLAGLSFIQEARATRR